MLTDALRINAPPVMCETLEEETIIVNLDSGSYYDLDPVGSHILLCLTRGSTPEATVQSVAERWGMAVPDVSDATLALIDQLVAEEIVISAGDGAHAPRPAVEEAATTRPYQPPQLRRFDDMQELLLLDPIHAFDASGWPTEAPVAPE